ncbi:MAG: methyl-accepting chemotaxis protein [Anaeromyxobacteraceae bacterium]
MTTAQKILAAFLASTLLLAAVGGFAYWSAGRIEARLDELHDNTVPTLNALAACAEGQAAAVANLESALFRREYPSVRRDAIKAMTAKLAQAEEGAKILESRPHTAEVKEAWETWRRLYGPWAKAAVAAGGAIEARLALGEGKEDPEIVAAEERAWSIYASSRTTFSEAADALENAKKAVLAEADAADASGAAAANRSMTLILAAVVFGAFSLVALGVFFARSIGAMLAALVREAGRLRDAVVAGRLSERSNAQGLAPELRPVLAGMDEILGAYHRPVHVAAESLDRIAKGDLPEPITEEWQGDFDGVKQSLNRSVATLQRLEADAAELADALVHGRLLTRADAAAHEGAYRRIVEGVNESVGSIVAHLDAVPAPAMVVDRDLKVLWMNKAATSVGGRALQDFQGGPCREAFCTGDCGTERCATAKTIQTGSPAGGQTVARPKGNAALAAAGVEIDYNAVPIRARGQVVGALEVVTDQTAVRRAMRKAEKVSAYQARETQRVVAALEKLSKGDLAMDVAVAEADGDTAEARQVYATISAAIERSAEAVRALTRDAAALVDAAIGGRLSTRADAGKHQGDFRKIVEGVNRTLDAVIAPVNDAVKVLEQLSKRDLRARVSGDYQGDHARIKEAVNATGEALHEALQQVAAAVDQVSSAATQIAASSQAVASGASEQASSLQETGASVESLAERTKHSADSAQQANLLAQNARTAAADGSQAVDQMQGVMNRIKASAEGTSQIIKDVSDIAFQTNLLALNAAVEAARAGEAGRGFAVVAEEVRSLALRAKEAATKTEELIRQSVKEAGEGETTAKHVSAKLGEIRGRDPEGLRHRGGDRGVVERAVGRDRAGEQGGRRDGQGHPAERGVGGGVLLGGERAVGPGRGARRDGRRVPPGGARPRARAGSPGPAAQGVRRPAGREAAPRREGRPHAAPGREGRGRPVPDEGLLSFRGGRRPPSPSAKLMGPSPGSAPCPRASGPGDTSPRGFTATGTASRAPPPACGGPRGRPPGR